jgi:CHAD domain-containing protein
VADTKFFVFNDNISNKQFSAIIKKPYSIKWTGTQNDRVSLLDSFDGRMLQAGYTVRYANNTLFFIGIKNSEKDYTIPMFSKEPPLFAHNFKDENIQKFLSGILDVRALIKRISLNLKTSSFIIIDADQKTIAGGKLVVSNPQPVLQKGEKVFCFVNPLRGYGKEFNSLIKDWPGFSTQSSFDMGILKIYDIKLINNSKPIFLFNKEMSISQALDSILKDSFEIMRNNEAGISKDTDIEFLHDYRVSGRRMRSALSLIKNVLSVEMSTNLINDLKQIGTISGPLRDLDVYLLREDEYKNSIPDGWSSKELHSIFVTLKTRRNKAYKNMTAMLASTNYQEMITRWDNFFENFKQFVENDKPIFSTASSLILKRYKRVLRDGAVLTEHSPDDGFHELRITCKKLRYLMEFFSSLYPAQKIVLAIKQLKKLQENLGDFNDLSVQIDTLNEFLANATKRKNTVLIQDISGLIAVLNFKKHQLRDEFHTLFEDFESAENKQLFNGMFAKG